MKNCMATSYVMSTRRGEAIVLHYNLGEEAVLHDCNNVGYTNIGKEQDTVTHDSSL